MNKRKIKRTSKKRENKAGKEVGGSSHLGSGNLWFQKGDASGEYFLVEDKFTTANKYSISLLVLDKLERQALKTDKIPVLRFGFEPHKDENYAVLRACDCCHLIDEIALDVFGTDKKSKTFAMKELENLYIKTMSSLFICKLNLNIKEYYILKWKAFVDQQGKFLGMGEEDAEV